MSVRPPYDYSPIVRRAPIEWPDGKRLAVWVGLNVEHFDYGTPSTSIQDVTAALVPDPLNHGWRDYGTRVGVWRIMDILDRHGVRASVLLNSAVCTEYPEIIEEGRRRGWVWLAHGRANSILQTGMEADEERAYLTEVVETIASHTRVRPKGWLGPALSETPRTLELLAELGVGYTCDWCADDQPFPMRVRGGRMISVPYSIEVNDIPLCVSKSFTGPDLYQLLVDQFDVLYAESRQIARVMNIAIHPFAVGQAFRSRHLDRALAYIAGHDDVWLTTSDEIADWYYTHYYERDAPPKKRS
ncbi:MAG: polysaccharide deacetylase family protein [Streptosporangiaceae bacterium]